MQHVARSSLAFLVLLTAVTWAGVAARAGGSGWEGKKLADLPTNFIVGYATLIDTPSRNSTAAKPIPAIPVRVLPSFGYIRSWNVHRDPFHFTAMGLRKANPGESGATINGVLYPAEGGDMSSFDRREEAYTRVEVPRSQIEAVGWQPLPETGHIWIYVPAAARLPGPDAEYPLLQSYIDVVVEGGLEYSPDFALEILETTDGWNRFWLNDRELAHRPWVEDPKAREVDMVLAKASTTAALLSARTFPEMYGEVLRERAPKQP
jgi:hypothetical protein